MNQDRRNSFRANSIEISPSYIQPRDDEQECDVDREAPQYMNIETISHGDNSDSFETNICESPYGEGCEITSHGIDTKLNAVPPFIVRKKDLSNKATDNKYDQTTK